MATQSGKNIAVSYKVEPSFNTVPTASGATRFRANASSGMKYQKGRIGPGEIRADLKTSMPRHGAKSAAGAYACDLSVGTFDALFEAITRGTWTPLQTISQATAGLTSISTVAAGPPGVITFSAGSAITAGFRVGDVIRLNVTGGPAGNNNRNLRVTAVTALTLTVADTLVADGTARATFSITIAKKVFQPGAVVNRSFTIEESHQDITKAEQYTGCRASSMKVTGSPNGMATAEFGFVGATGIPLAAPFYTSPTLSSSLGLVFVDATLRFGGADVVNLTAFDLMLDLTAQTQAVIGSQITPDVFPNAASLKGTLSATRQDLTNMTRFDAETELEFQALLVEPTAEPKNFISIYIPRLKIMDGVDAPFGQDGAMIETMNWEAGDREVVTGYDDTMIMINTSAP